MLSGVQLVQVIMITDHDLWFFSAFIYIIIIDALEDIQILSLGLAWQYMYIYVCMYVCMYVCTNMYMYVHMYVLHVYLCMILTLYLAWTSEVVHV